MCGSSEAKEMCAPQRELYLYHTTFSAQQMFQASLIFYSLSWIISWTCFYTVISLAMFLFQSAFVAESKPKSTSFFLKKASTYSHSWEGWRRCLFHARCFSAMRTGLFVMHLDFSIGLHDQHSIHIWLCTLPHCLTWVCPFYKAINWRPA